MDTFLCPVWMRSTWWRAWIRPPWHDRRWGYWGSRWFDEGVHYWRETSHHLPPCSSFCPRCWGCDCASNHSRYIRGVTCQCPHSPWSSPHSKSNTSTYSSTFIICIYNIHMSFNEPLLQSIHHHPHPEQTPRLTDQFSKRLSLLYDQFRK